MTTYPKNKMISILGSFKNSETQLNKTQKNPKSLLNSMDPKKVRITMNSECLQYLKK